MLGISGLATISQGPYRQSVIGWVPGIYRAVWDLYQCIIQDLHRVMGMFSCSLPDLLSAACSRGR